MRSEEFSSSSELWDCWHGFGITSCNFSALSSSLSWQISGLAPTKTNDMWKHHWPVYVSVSFWLYLMFTVFIFELPVFIHSVFLGYRCPTSGYGKCVHVRKMFLHTCATIIGELNSTVNVAWGLVRIFHCKPIKTNASLMGGMLSELSDFASRFHACSFNMTSGALCRIPKPHGRSFQLKLYWIRWPVLECFFDCSIR